MTDAPERIWATEDAANFGEDKFHTRHGPMKGLTEYTRAGYFAPSPIWDDVKTFDGRPHIQGRSGMIEDNDVEDGSVCNQAGCSGHFGFAKVVGCSCHISPPCSACTSAGFVCDTCGYDTTPAREPDYYERQSEVRDRSKEWTSTHTANAFNSTPFTRCCGVAAIGTDRCPRCKAQIAWHDDGLAERRRWAKGGCLMCGKPHGDISIAGNCCC